MNLVYQSFSWTILLKGFNKSIIKVLKIRRISFFKDCKGILIQSVFALQKV